MNSFACRFFGPIRAAIAAALVVTFVAATPRSTLAAAWTTHGPYGGIADIIVADPKTPATVYEASHGGGVFKSTDSGAHWVRASTGLTAPLVKTLVIDPTNSKILYAAGGNGVFRSVDGAAHWTQVNGLVNVLQIAINPTTPTTLFAVVSQGSLFKSTDSGTTWTSQFNALPSQTLYSVVIDPLTPANIYVGAQGGVWRTTNGGTSWTLVSSGFGSGFIIVQSLLIDPKTPRNLYANAGDGLKKSVNGGVTWTAVASEPSSSFILLAIDPTTPTRLYGINLSITGSIYSSTNAGSTWVKLAALTTDFAGNIRSLAVDPKTGTRLYTGTDHGVFLSADTGKHWTDSNTGLANTLVTSLAIDPKTPATLYAGTEYGGLFKSTDSAATWVRIDDDWMDKVSALLIDPTTPTTLYFSSYFGNGIFKSTDSGATWTNILPSTTVLSFALDPVASSYLYAGTGGGSSTLLRSGNAGRTWVTINHGLPAPGVLQAGALSVYDHTLVLTDFSNGVYTSSNYGNVWVANNPQSLSAATTRPAGTAGAGTPGSGVQYNISTGLSDGVGLAAAAIFIGIAKVEEDPKTGSFREGFSQLIASGGQSAATPAASSPSWTPWAGPTGVDGSTCAPITALAQDPALASAFYAGGSCGVLKGTRYGASLAAWGTGLPANLSVDALVVAPNRTTLYAGVFGGGVWKLGP